MKGEDADLVVFNAEIHILNEGNKIVEAMAIKDGRIIEFGPDRQILNKYAYKSSIDARGKEIYPGFIDSHGHLLSYAELLLSADLVGSNSQKDMIERVVNYQDVNNKKIVIGRGWDQSLWDDSSFPDNQLLNESFKDTPVCLYRIDGHSALINDAFINLLGEFQVPDGGEVLTRTDGHYSGLFIDAALMLLDPFIPKFPDAAIKEKLKEIQSELFSYGVTGVHEAGVDFEELELLDQMATTNELSLNIYAMLSPTQANLDFAKEKGIYRNKNLLVRSFKAYVDGALGSSGALLKESYHDHPNYTGLSLTSVEALSSLRDYCLSVNYQLNCHGIGDSAVARILNMCKVAYHKKPDHRFRVEHAQLVSPNDFELFNKYAVFPSVQPTHATTDQRWAASKIGQERLKGAYANKSLLNQFGMIALGTDFPVEYTNPFYTIHSAVNRRTPKNYPEKGFLSDEALTMEETLRGMTIWGAFASFQEEELGSLEKGKQATFVVLDRPINHTSSFMPNYSWLTCIEGRIVHSLE
jgi:predicted amidohydrolase YtcJ|tara:strand:+ start:222 stop:1796 length:1575 start_codon:yes stop_codon:yes gene_type:complete